MFGKKKKKNDAGNDASKTKPAAETSGKKKKTNSSPEIPDGKKKKRFTLKKILFILMFLIAMAVAAAVVYRLYFIKDENAYIKRDTPHVSLGDEIISFIYYFMPETYGILMDFNTEVTLLNQEIERIKALGETYPAQKKITEKELKSWEKTKSNVLKNFAKIEQQLEALYVSYRVNEEQGHAQVEALKIDLARSAKEALLPSMELTKRLKMKPAENIPKGFIKGNIYKIKKKISNLF